LHYNSQRTISVNANVGGRDLARAAAAVDRTIASLGAPPKGVTVAVHGQVEQMRTTLDGLRVGLLLTVVVVVLLLAANYQSFREPLAVLATIPGVLAGVVIALHLTGTTVNVQSLMGGVMSIGVSVANAVLLVTFARTHRAEGKEAVDAGREAAVGRLRPIAMTSLAMIVGMAPMALGIAQGGDQSAPLGRAVIGGLVGSTIATLLVLPAAYVIFQRRGPWRPISLAPEDVEHDPLAPRQAK
jgi:multidrug efflux pump subunit AcrB